MTYPKKTKRGFKWANLQTDSDNNLFKKKSCYINEYLKLKLIFKGFFPKIAFSVQYTMLQSRGDCFNSKGLYFSTPANQYT